MHSADVKNKFLELNKACWDSSLDGPLYGHFYPLDRAGPTREARLKLRQTLVAHLEELALAPPPSPTTLASIPQLLIPGIPPQSTHAAISISHCQTWAGFIFKPDPNPPLGLDIEQKSRITKKLVSRISRREEVEGAPSYAFLWGAKEAAFKAVSTKPGDLILGKVHIEGWETLDFQTQGFSFHVHGTHGTHGAHGTHCAHGVHGTHSVRAGTFQKEVRGEGYVFEIEDLVFTIARCCRIQESKP